MNQRPSSGKDAMTSKDKIGCRFCCHQVSDYGCGFVDGKWVCKNMASSMNPNHYMYSVESTVARLLTLSLKLKKDASDLHELALELDKRVSAPAIPKEKE